MMKCLTLIGIIGANLVACGAFASALKTSNAVIVPAPVEKVFVPNGFDDNDKVELVVHGHFVSSCYKMGPVSAVVDTSTHSILVTAEAYYYPGAFCVQMLIPYVKSVELNGPMPVGKYQVRVKDSTEAGVANLEIVRAPRPEADDFLYAGVQSVDFVKNGNGAEIVLRGRHPHMFDGCVKLDRIKTQVSSANVIVVQPITRILSNEECAGTTEYPDPRFEWKVKLDDALTRGEYLLHVRVLDGNAINQLILAD